MSPTEFAIPDRRATAINLMSPTDSAIPDRWATAINLMSPTDFAIPGRRAAAMDIIGIEGRSMNKVELFSGEIAAQGEDAEESIRALRN